MNSRPRRPIGVTLIALMFLWIGCLGTLFFPIIGLTGATGELWRLILGSRIHSEGWFRTLSYLLDTVWFLLYIAYAVIGFGLWKLKNSARKAVLGLMALLTLGGLVVAVVFAKSVALGCAIFGMAVVEPGWLAWYLMRPRVRYAFGIWNRYTPAGEWIEPPGLSRSGKVGVCLLIPVSLAVLFVVPLYIAIAAEMRNSYPYKLAMANAQASPCVVHTLGLPLHSGFWISGSEQESSTEGSAELSIPLKGPTGNGELDVQAAKQKSRWSLVSLVFIHDGKRTILVPAVANGGCR
jgi:Cytochrome oxidase complex assembly protein 1